MNKYSNSTLKGEDFSDVRILLADDEVHMLDSLQALMSYYGYQVDTALGGQAAIEKLSQGNYDILLLDLKMPGTDGHTVMEYMAANELETLTIVVSGETSYQDMSRALRNGGYDYLKKPYAPEELIATVNNAIRKCRLELVNRSMQSRLRKSEQLHRFIVNNSLDLIFMLDDQGCFSFLNSKIEKQLDYRNENLVGQPFLTIVEAEDVDRAQMFFKHLDMTRDRARVIELALKHRTDAKIRRHFEVSVWPIREQYNDDIVQNKNKFRIYCAARDVTDRKEAEAFINFQAYHDLLTRLPNRALFKDRLNVAMEQAKRNKTKLAVMFLDLDRFKLVNDSLGHSVGDRLLQAVSLRLTRCLRRGDTLSRFGGDEFTLLLPDVNDHDGATLIADKIIGALKQPFRLGEHEIYVGVSIGIVIFPEAGSDIDTLIQNADIAMYQVKDRGKDGYAFYSPDMNIATQQRLTFERDIRRALENDEFRVFYQPQVDVRTGKVVGVEALIRWQHPDKGLVFPGDFIPIAEETRLILEIDRWILRNAIRETKSWFDRGLPKVRLSVNFSPWMVEQPDFVELLLETLDEEQLPREYFELEITENVILSDIDHTIEKLVILNEEGVSIALDDFGTGYSSLSYLQKFPINTLKIDQAFVQNIQTDQDEACIVNAIVAMAQGLKLDIIAEGVETETQLNYLKQLGCHTMQGFLFGEAKTAEDVVRAITGRQITRLELA